MLEVCRTSGQVERLLERLLGLRKRSLAQFTRSKADHMINFAPDILELLPASERTREMMLRQGKVAKHPIRCSQRAVPVSGLTPHGMPPPQLQGFLDLSNAFGHIAQQDIAHPEAHIDVGPEHHLVHWQTCEHLLA